MYIVYRVFTAILNILVILKFLPAQSDILCLLRVRASQVCHHLVQYYILVVRERETW